MSFQSLTESEIANKLLLANLFILFNKRRLMKVSEPTTAKLKACT